LTLALLKHLCGSLKNCGKEQRYSLAPEEDSDEKWAKETYSQAPGGVHLEKSSEEDDFLDSGGIVFLYFLGGTLPLQPHPAGI